MNKRFVLAIVVIATFLSAFQTAVCANITVGVKQDDWIEYKTNITGTPPESHDITSARMEIVGVMGVIINLNVTSKFSNGTLLLENVTLNLETGQLGDDFVIPANLDVGDSFFDIRIGNVTISKLEEKTIAGATRTVVHAKTEQTIFYWDRATGVLAEANSSFPDYGFTLDTTVAKTNMWQPQTSGPYTNIGYILAAAVVAVATLIALAIILRRKGK